MSCSPEIGITLPAKPFNAAQVTAIVNEALTMGRFKIEEAILSSGDNSPVEVTALEQRDSVAATGNFYLITDLKGDARYDFLANRDDQGWGFESSGMSRLKVGVPTARLVKLTIDETDGGWIHWYLPKEGSELNIEGKLDPLMDSIAARLRL